MSEFFEVPAGIVENTEYEIHIHVIEAFRVVCWTVLAYNLH